MNYKKSFIYTADYEQKQADGSNEDFYLIVEDRNDRLKVTLVPNKPITDLKFSFVRSYSFYGHSKFFANGFQSWTDTREFMKEDKMGNLGALGKGIAGLSPMGTKYMGDYTFVPDEKVIGTFHSHSFAYMRHHEEVDLAGSLDDSTGYTTIRVDMNNLTLSFSKDVEGVEFTEPYVILDIVFIKGKYNEVFDKYFDLLGVKPRTTEKIKGYTSWYNYYQHINENIILRDLEAIGEYKDYVNTFQIDDGYQTAVGDWLSIDPEKFPNGLKPIVERIHDKGLKAGLWLAPFGAQKGSVIAKEHPDWLINNINGSPICVGANWGGFYPIDIYNEEAKAYIKHCFDVILNDWGFDLVKLDFLYAASIIPMYGKSRGEIAYDSIDFLRECVGDKLILGCGVQQMPCFGKVDYMRIGADMALGWKNPPRSVLMHREDVSTINAIRNSIYRRCLNGRAFMNDSDVFLLRRTNINFTPLQQKTLAKFIKIFSGVLFMSDNVADYDSDQLATFRDTLTENTVLTDVHEVDGIVTVSYTENEKPRTLRFNVLTGEIY